MQGYIRRVRRIVSVPVTDLIETYLELPELKLPDMRTGMICRVCIHGRHFNKKRVSTLQFEGTIERTDMPLVLRPGSFEVQVGRFVRNKRSKV